MRFIPSKEAVEAFAAFPGSTPEGHSPTGVDRRRTAGRASTRPTAHNRAMKSDLIALLPRLRCYARVLTETLQQADKLVVDTLACANERRDLGQKGTTLRTRLLTIMRELHMRESKHVPRNAAPLDADEDAKRPGKMPDADPRRGTGEPAETLDHFSRLPVEQREVLVLVAVEELAYDEIAALLGVSIATVMARLSAARESMRSMASESPSRGMVAK
jgi:RNA polymerase sigma-70 factor, ECF subfamily